VGVHCAAIPNLAETQAVVSSDCRGGSRNPPAARQQADTTSTTSR
jgi:hypothetical protein